MSAVPASPLSPVASSIVSTALAAEIALRHYGVVAAAERLASEFDDTFRLVGDDGSRWLLKVGAEPVAAEPVAAEPAGADTDAAASAGGAGFQTALLLHLAAVAPELPVQRVVPTLDGRPELRRSGRLVRMTSWLDGRLLGAGESNAGLRRDIGGTLARLNLALRGFAHPGAGRTHRWDLQRFGALRPLLAELPETGRGLAESGRGLAESGRGGLAECLDRFDAVVAPLLAGVATQVIHTDFHGENLLTDDVRVTGILDFGDALTGPVAMDVGVAACYQLGAAGPDGPAEDLLAPALDVVRGYHAVDPLSRSDLDLVAEFMVARVAARIILSQAHAARDPGNARYLLRRTPAAVAHFATLRAIGHDEIGRRLGAACEREVAL
jgi:Ser/Thr protein kinase RdoA (MazF antagonist)